MRIHLRTKSSLQLALALLPLGLFAPATNEDARASWPAWRGPTRDGLAQGPLWPADLSLEHLKLRWKLEQLGPSYSGPVVDALRVYTTETVDREYEVVRALDRNTGEELWSTRWKGAHEVPFFAARNGSWIRSTPAVDGDALYVAGIRDVLTCLDASSGAVRWRVDFSERHGSSVPQFGCVSSPLVSGQYIYIQAGAALCKLDKETGASLWRTLIEEGGAMSEGAFSSPVLAELGGRTQLVVQSRVELCGVAPEDGSLLWSVPIKSFRGMNILTPSVVGEGIFTSTYGGRSQFLGVQAGEAGWSVDSEWNTGVQGYMTSAVIADGHAYLFLRSNRFACIDLETGKERWTSPPTGDSYQSLALQGERILALSDDGVLRLIRTSPEAYEVLSEREVQAGETWAHVAPAGDQIFVRSLDSLIALDWK